MLLSGEGDDVDPSDEGVQHNLQTLRSVLKEAELDCTYNMDETGLFFRQLPNRTFILQSELKGGKLYLKRLRGKKGLIAKDRVTVVACANAPGTSRVPLAVIGTAKRPEVFKRVCTPNSKWVKYKNQKNAWFNKDICQWWFDHVFVPHVKGRHSGKVYLLWDNCSCHRINNWHKDIIILYLPKGTTLWFQPMDQGILAVLKRAFKRELLLLLVETFDEWESLQEKAASMPRGCAGVAQG